MSDLAPFVAAHIRDKVVEDLQEEVEALKEENRLLRKFKLGNMKITGPAGSPVYVCNRLGPEKKYLTAYAYLRKQKRECPLSSLFGLELQLSGTDVFELAQAHCSLVQRELRVDFYEPHMHLRFKVVGGEGSQGFLEEMFGREGTRQAAKEREGWQFPETVRDIKVEFTYMEMRQNTFLDRYLEVGFSRSQLPQSSAEE